MAGQRTIRGGYLWVVTTTDRIRALAMALPEVTEKQHFRWRRVTIFLSCR